MDDAIVIALIGPATLVEAPRLRDDLRESLRRGREVRVDLKEAGPWDAVGLQLLIASVASANRDGSTIRFVNVAPGCLAVAERAGLRDWIDRHREATPE